MFIASKRVDLNDTQVFVQLINVISRNYHVEKTAIIYLLNVTYIIIIFKLEIIDSDRQQILTDDLTKTVWEWK